MGEAEWAWGALGRGSTPTGIWEGTLASALQLKGVQEGKQNGWLGSVASQGGRAASSSEWLECRVRESRGCRGPGQSWLRVLCSNLRVELREVCMQRCGL